MDVITMLGSDVVWCDVLSEMPRGSFYLAQHFIETDLAMR
jgi:hypothetical protein